MTQVFRILLAATGSVIDLATIGVFYALYRLTFHINITPGNLGIREIAYGLLCAGAHIGMSKGLLISAELRIFSAIILIVIGLAIAGNELKTAWITSRNR
jgi:putative Mn2+ efflux pump MntP